MSNATEMHLAAQLLAREFARGEVSIKDDEDLEWTLRISHAYLTEFLKGRPRDMEDRILLAADVCARVYREMYGG